MYVYGVKKKIKEPGAVAHVCNPSYSQGRDQEVVQTSPGK
jgi:hypothetical protein